MSQYFYLVATLPYISYDAESFPPLESFLVACREQMTESDYRKLTSCSLEPHPLRDNGDSSGACEEFSKFERGLRNALVKLRAARLGLDPVDFIATDAGGNDYTDQTTPADAAHQAFTSESPAVAEEILDRARWTRLDELSLEHYFDLDYLSIYYLKLQVLERKSRRTREAGTTAFNQAYESVISTIPQLE